MCDQESRDPKPGSLIGSQSRRAVHGCWRPEPNREVPPSDSYSIAQRPVKTAWRLRDRLHSAPVPKAGGYRGGRGAGKKTLARRRAERDAADIRALRSLLRCCDIPAIRTIKIKPGPADPLRPASRDLTSPEL